MATLWVIGDSTLSSFNDKYYYPRYGYGTRLDVFLDESVEVENIALSGRSSKSYMAEPEYKKLLDGMKQGDFLLIGFGHNDEKREAARHTAGEGDYTTPGSFANSLYENYYLKALERGTRTILCTPIVRRTVDGVWSDDSLHITGNQGDFIGGDYSQAIRDLGADCDIPVVDMTKLTKELYDSLGCEETMYLHAWPSNKSASVDNTHTNIWGARVNAFLCLRAVKELGVAGLSEHILIDEASDLPSKVQYLVSDPAYVPVVYDSNLKDSKLWKDFSDYRYNQAGIVPCFKGTVFGDVLDDKFDDFTLEPVDGGVHIAVANNNGKISGVTDGIAMYYMKLPVTANFTIRAKARINDYFKNDQVSFGLMVRDDCYVDMMTPEGLGDYVAAAPYMLTRQKGLVNCFARKSGKIFYNSECEKELNIGDEVALEIRSSNDGYACTFNNECTVTGGFDFKLTSIDAENVYVGMFVSRNADITFTDIELVIE